MTASPKVLFVASEAMPFVKTGGLADALPKARLVGNENYQIVIGKGGMV